MSKNIHLTFSSISALYVISKLDLPPEHSLLSLSIIVISSLLPDIDTPYSYLGRKLKPISYLIYHIFGHRTITHSLLIWTLLLIASPIFLHTTTSIIIFFSMYLGIMSHILLDMISPIGVPLLYPLTKYNFHLIPRFKKKR